MYQQAFDAVSLNFLFLFYSFLFLVYNTWSVLLIQLDSFVSILQVEIEVNILYEFSVQCLKEKQVVKSKRKKEPLNS